jgi:hypothetical protein
MAGISVKNPSPSLRNDSDAAASRTMPLAIIPPSNPHEIADDLSDEGDDLSDEDAESLIGPAMSRVATRLKSPKTPALEKINALREGGGYFEAGPETPPSHEVMVAEDVEAVLSSRTPTPPGTTNPPSRHKPTSLSARQNRGLSLGALPTPRPESPGFPISPWQPGPRPLVVEPSDRPQSSLHAVFSGTDRKRSLSGGADALRKLLPKALPSMAQVGNLFSSSSHSGHSRSASSSLSGGSPPQRSSQPRTFEPIVSSHHSGNPRPKVVRRVTSDDSLLYHSLSRTSSLGDDTRFENHHDQVNSRVKAIRDSLQDRSSFRLPQMPSMPSMPNFNFNINFLNSNSVPARLKSESDLASDILPTGTKKKPMIAAPAVGPGMNGATEPEFVRSANEGSSANFLDRAMNSLTGDVVIMGGYRGSILRSTKTNRQVWVPVKVGLNIRKVDLEVGLEPEAEERMSETIYASGMLQNIGPVDISKRLFKKLAECENAKNGKLRVWDYGYDWRLSPHLLSRRLTTFLEELPSNQPNAFDGNGGAVVIAHSLGGLITRHVVNKRPELFSGVVYAGVPKSCVNILGPIRNGDAVLLSSRVLTAQVNFSLRTSFVLLPEDGSCFVDINTKERYPVDFFNLDDWIKYRWSPCTDPPLPPRLQPSGGLGSILNLSSSLLSLPVPGKKPMSDAVSPPASVMSSDTQIDCGSAYTQQLPSKTTRAADAFRNADRGTDRTLAPQMGNKSNPVNKGQSTNSSVSTAVTIPREKAIEYLRRTLSETKKFKQELHFKPELSQTNKYPPLAVIYGKSIPTCCGAKVDGREGIPCSDSYDNLAFASGDGVCLAREAMLPEGYKVAYGGRIRSERGHVTLLGDLNAVGRALEAIIKGRTKGIGLGLKECS